MTRPLPAPAIDAPSSPAAANGRHRGHLQAPDLAAVGDGLEHRLATGPTGHRASQGNPDGPSRDRPRHRPHSMYCDSCTGCGRVIEVSKEQAEAAARQVSPDLR